MAHDTGTSAETFGQSIEHAYAGIRWRNGDKALLLSCLCVRVPRTRRGYMGDWWPAGHHDWIEFHGLLMRVSTHSLTVKWIVPFWILERDMLVHQWNQQRQDQDPDFCVRVNEVALSSQYSDDVPFKWIAGTAALRLPRHVDIKLGKRAHPRSRAHTIPRLRSEHQAR